MLAPTGLHAWCLSMGHTATLVHHTWLVHILKMCL